MLKQKYKLQKMIRKQYVIRENRYYLAKETRGWRKGGWIYLMKQWQPMMVLKYVNWLVLFLQHYNKDWKLCLQWNISCSIPIGTHVLACVVNVLHNMVFKTKIKQLKRTVSLENIVGNISSEKNTEITSSICLDTIKP